MPLLSVGKENSGHIELYYEDHGSGKPVLLVHGWPLSGTSYEKQTLALIANGYRVITYDRRGFGKSSQPTTGYNYDTLAEDLHKLVAKLDLHDAALVGFSMGGGEVARYLATHGSDRFKKAAFLAAIPPFLLKTVDNPCGMDSSVFADIKKALTADRPAFLAAFFQNFYNLDLLLHKRISNHVVQLSWATAVAASPKATLDCVSAWLTDFRPDLAKISLPTLVLHGDADRILPLAATGLRLHNSLPHSHLTVLPNAPHGLLWTHADEVNRELLAFLHQ